MPFSAISRPVEEKEPRQTKENADGLVDAELFLIKENADDHEHNGESDIGDERTYADGHAIAIGKNIAQLQADDGEGQGKARPVQIANGGEDGFCEACKEQGDDGDPGGGDIGEKKGKQRVCRRRRGFCCYIVKCIG